MESSNNNAMREALLALSAWAKTVKDNPKDQTAIECAEFVATAVAAALAAPARNCDKYHDEGEARSAWYKENPCGSCKNERADCALCYGEWIFAIAKKGDSDGIK